MNSAPCAANKICEDPEKETLRQLKNAAELPRDDDWQLRKDLLQMVIAFVGTEAGRVLAGGDVKHYKFMNILQEPQGEKKSSETKSPAAKDEKDNPSMTFTIRYPITEGHPEETPEIKEQRVALIKLAPFMQGLQSRYSNYISKIYVSLPSGLHGAIPYYGDYPVSFDPRQREWYKKAQDNANFSWTIIKDIVTKEMIITLSLPVFDSSAKLACVIGMDIPLLTLLNRTKLSRILSVPSKSMILFSDQDGKLAVVAEREYSEAEGRWKMVPDKDAFTAAEQTRIKEEINKAGADKTAIFNLPFEGKDSRWAIAPLEGPLYSVVILPNAN